MKYKIFLCSIGLACALLSCKQPVELATEANAERAASHTSTAQRGHTNEAIKKNTDLCNYASIPDVKHASRIVHHEGSQARTGDICGVWKLSKKTEYFARDKSIANTYRYPMRIAGENGNHAVFEEYLYITDEETSVYYNFSESGDKNGCYKYNAWPTDLMKTTIGGIYCYDAQGNRLVVTEKKASAYDAVNKQGLDLVSECEYVRDSSIDQEVFTKARPIIEFF